MHRHCRGDVFYINKRLESKKLSTECVCYSHRSGCCCCLLSVFKQQQRLNSLWITYAELMLLEQLHAFFSSARRRQRPLLRLLAQRHVPSTPRRLVPDDADVHHLVRLKKILSSITSSPLRTLKGETLNLFSFLSNNLCIENYSIHQCCWGYFSTSRTDADGITNHSWSGTASSTPFI